jgi:5-deoxy-D-glucuronate isomerase
VFSEFRKRPIPEKIGEETMGLAQYAIVPVRGQWGVLHDGNIHGEYATKESAFESAAAAASLAIRQGHEVHVSVPAREAGESALGD